MNKTALFNKHVSLGAKMVPFAGFEMPVQYSGVTEEHFTVREKVGIFDVSHMGQFFIEGAGAKELLQYVTSNNVEALENGKAQYSCLPNGKGGIVDDLIVYKMEDQKYFVVVNASNIDKDWQHISKYNEKFGAKMTNASDEISLIAIQGPKALDTLQKLTDNQLADIPYYHFTVGSVDGVADVIISNTGYTGSGGFEIYFKNEYAEQIWDALTKAGEEFGLIPCGLAARDTLRLEKGFCLYGNDIDDTTSPLEAGLGWITKLDTEFVDRDFLAQQKEQGITRKLVGFEMQEKAIPRHDYPVVDSEGNIIGKVTSGTMSPMKKIGLGLAYVDQPHFKLGSEIFIQIRNKNVPAKVVKIPFV
ncbi:glycine cleavage system protein T [Riemerella anatipestifer]|uniref:Aminomethyltransferase n=1 Tax=Riemerella anatipestifer (strain ATCC 11845 / DSM 15868 / JCM 9532 / NCTC 11014) TaxID=693978 RepID=E4TBA1_RIEAD|nr:glycine cleavage system aminomethyltransferase GcvT [Riemerella anatipestifer]ADQ81337.1 glycine cleavage system T protein [Riemerella anatipestifer ATCC 11845 = DSM 15868]AFD55355.1 glycine cleavage system t protein [Riemerella anatipestifer ATCC 11845 = DSM 15868]MDD1524170.1 glycine cleavage system aminomethyltransferase GcvT [Riemerella anatipestifer]MRM91989.1 glycine cleavage system aminomethyltransferase GcvT [Riemerella anatipestifer]MRN05670.1 glycine cleavage system aminomethyltra